MRAPTASGPEHKPQNKKLGDSTENSRMKLGMYCIAGLLAFPVAKRALARNVATAAAALLATLTLAPPTLAQSASEQTVRAVEFDYHPVHGQVILERIDPGLPSCIEKSYSHDEFGNRSKTEVRPCAAATDANHSFKKRVTEAKFDAPASQSGVPMPGPFTHRPGAYTTETVNYDDANQVLSRAQAVYDVRFGTVTKQTTVALADATRSLHAFIEYDGFGRVAKETSAIGTSVEYKRVYCLGALSAVTPAADKAFCIAFTQSLVVDIASNRLVDTSGQPSPAQLSAVTAYYIESTPFDNQGVLMGAKSRVHFDSLNREIAKESQAYDGRWSRALKAYDQLGLASAQWDAHFVPAAGGTHSPPAELRQWASRFDEIHRPIEQKNFARDSEGASPVERITQIAYNGLETATVVTAGSSPDGNERRAITLKNGAGQTAQTVDVYGATVNSAYDAVGQLRKTVTALGTTTVLSYTPGTARFKVAMDDPNAGSWSYQYDALGQLKQQTDAKLQVTTLKYDALGRMTEKSSNGQNPALDLVSRWYHDRNAAGVWCAAGLNRLCESVAGNAESRWERFAYDTLGRPSSTITKLDREYTNSATYNAQTGAVHSLSYPTGFAVQYKYSDVASGRTPGVLEQVFDAATAARVFWRIDDVAAGEVFDAQGRVLKARLGNGVISNSVFDPISGKALALQAGMPGNLLGIQNNAYVYDAANNLQSRQDRIAGLTETFKYDRLDRLTEYKVDSGSDAYATRTVTVGYNAAGNILSKSDLGGYVYGSATGPRPHAVQTAAGTSYTYDANGALTGTTGAQQRTHTWTSFNQPASMSYGSNSVAFLYDASLKRVQETVTTGATVRTVYMVHPNNAGGLGFEREEVRNGGSLVRNENRHFISVGGAVIAVVKTDNALNSTELNGVVSSDPGRTNYWHKDTLGSVIAVSNGVGAGVEHMAFDAWGRRIRPTGANDAGLNPAHGDRGFTGHEHLDELAVVHMNGRMYDPLLGRFFSIDPHIQSPDDLQNYNRYSYVLNNPLRYTDPNGELWWQVAAFVVGAMLAHNGNQYWRMVGTIMMMASLSQPGGLVEAGLGEVVITEAACVGNSFVAGGIGNSMLSAAIATAATPGSNTSDIVSAGLFAGAFTAVGGLTQGPSIQKFAGHALLGCAQGMASGGQCGPSAAAAFAGKGMTEGLPADVGDVGRGIATALAGGTASVIGGGKFANGAFQAGFGYIYNHLLSKIEVRGLYGKARGHHPFAKQWANDYADSIDIDALNVLSARTLGSEIKWEGNHPNKFPGEGGAHYEYNNGSGRRVVERFLKENNISRENQLNVKQAYRLLENLERQKFNVDIQKYVDIQRQNGRFRPNWYRPKAGYGQSQD